MRRVGLYVPGGLAVYPSSVVMNVVPAQAAGVGSLAVASPPQRENTGVFAGFPNPTILAGGAIEYGRNNEAPQDSAASWLADPYLCPHNDSYFSVYAAYEGETAYRTVFHSPGLPFIYGMNSTQGNYSRPGFNSDTLPGFCFFKPESYMNAYFGSGSQGPPLGHTVRYTQIILSRNFIPCPQA